MCASKISCWGVIFSLAEAELALEGLKALSSTPSLELVLDAALSLGSVAALDGSELAAELGAEALLLLLPLEGWLLADEAAEEGSLDAVLLGAEALGSLAEEAEGAALTTEGSDDAEPAELAPSTSLTSSGAALGSDAEGIPPELAEPPEEEDITTTVPSLVVVAG